ncbi:hypothetical protein B0T14DRAFT_522970 [Immersiella caudata]|uniref:Uncharacterized protein n=1 Tax=Immersiella caudata TaxID=314043 RepID=A0AA39WJ25_9PEZI|nr:hypothetical protein B0T14DRAFT_522970 [Immersiella caudata]
MVALASAVDSSEDCLSYPMPPQRCRLPAGLGIFGCGRMNISHPNCSTGAILVYSAAWHDFAGCMNPQGLAPQFTLQGLRCQLLREFYTGKGDTCSQMFKEGCPKIVRKKILAFFVAANQKNTARAYIPSHCASASKPSIFRPPSKNHRHRRSRNCSNSHASCLHRFSRPRAHRHPFYRILLRLLYRPLHVGEPYLKVVIPALREGLGLVEHLFFELLQVPSLTRDTQAGEEGGGDAVVDVPGAFEEEGCRGVEGRVFAAGRDCPLDVDGVSTERDGLVERGLGEVELG